MSAGAVNAAETVLVGPPIEGVPEVEREAAALIDAEAATRLLAVPIAVSGGRLRVAMVKPGDGEAADEIAVTAGLPVTRHGIEERHLRTLLRVHYGTTAAELGSRLGGGDDAGELLADIETIDADALHRMAEQPTLINLVNLLILEGIRSRASDIHIEPFETRLAVKYRIDGVLAEQSPPPRQLQPAITSRVKIMAGMNIAERYVPQDGHITLRFEGRKVDIRVSTVPTIYGESLVMRLLDKESISLELASLGMREPDRAAMERLVALPHGMALVTGPTGSGKTTTLYAALTKLYTPEKKILTIEDPVEYELSGVNQIPVNPKRGLSFATGLRSILRQDPDVIMVGEIRDGETAEIAVRSALTGHLVLSTLHTNDATSAAGRLIDMGVEPFLLASTLEGVIAQRLGRRLRDDRRERRAMSDAARHRMTDAELALFEHGMCWQPVDAGDGEPAFRGRIGFYEMLEVNAGVRQAIAEGGGQRAIDEAAGTAHVTMRTDGLIKAAEGLTTVDEVLRATQDADEAVA